MLEKKDLELLKDVMESIVQESESRMIDHIQESENRMAGKMEVLIQESENKMAGRIQESENRMTGKMEVLIQESENMILEELDRVQINLEKRIDKVEKNLDELNQYYRITKLENDNTAILLKMVQDQSKTLEDQATSIDSLSKRVDVLENGKKSA